MNLLNDPGAAGIWRSRERACDDLGKMRGMEVDRANER